MISNHLNSKLLNIRLIVFDVDGTLTDGAMYYSQAGEAMKRFSTRDGMGFTLLQRAGILTAIITSENSEISQKRAEKLKINEIILASRDKTSSIMQLSKKLDIKLQHIAYMGDDINDEHIMRLCGISACPSDAVNLIRQTADYVCRANGGNGAAREFCELVLLAQDKSITLTENW